MSYLISLLAAPAFFAAGYQFARWRRHRRETVLTITTSAGGSVRCYVPRDEVPW